MVGIAVKARPLFRFGVACEIQSGVFCRCGTVMCLLGTWYQGDGVNVFDWRVVLTVLSAFSPV